MAVRVADELLGGVVDRAHEEGGVRVAVDAVGWQ
jgi:hypothetical protein